ncbi:MAG: 3-phosphoshikimate 1-carboxyvinyltransferase [Actinobacteria bacterium]|nr:3-phosphoshikimate 1-carboxyvinyltransferase [Actinomycetota bacterium]MBL7060227.1 3-phosphoshikimate 1-carboxyvinyltransferase [Actinomycetota bacterium]
MEVQGKSSIQGEIKVPGDKSISHRSAIISSTIRGTVVIENFLFSEDCIRTIEILKKLGIKIEKLNSNLVVKGEGIENFKEPVEVLDVGNSGTTIRIISGVLSATKFMTVLSGDSSVNSRPMDRIIKPLNEMGANIYGRDNNTKAPLVIFGSSGLKGKEFLINISSAQVKSSIILAALHAKGETEIIQPNVSRDHTERMLEYFGANISYNGKYTKIIPGNKLRAKNVYIPGDISSAAYFIVAALILKGSHLIIKDVGINPTRCYFLEILKKMGGRITIKNIRKSGNEPFADIEVSYSNLNSIIIEKEKIPVIIDEIPIICAAAAKSDGKTIINGAGELRYKESDRISSIVSQFKKLGIKVKEKEDNLIIEGDKNLRVGEGSVDSFGDHRIAMSLAILSLLSKGKVKILRSDCINTSFPDFKYILKKLLI